MEQNLPQNLPIISKKIWNLMRVMFFMLKKGISKAKLFTDLNMLVKHGKLAGKSLHNLLFHHHHNWAAATLHYRHPHHLPVTTPPSDEYEFNCNDTPPYPLSLFSTHKKKQSKQLTREIKQTDKYTQYDTANGRVYGEIEECDESKPDTNNEIFINAKVMKALEGMLITSAARSPGFVNSPVVRQLRITDSPFPLSNGDEDGKVDEAADKFIMRFYNDLRKQS